MSVKGTWGTKYWEVRCSLRIKPYQCKMNQSRSAEPYERTISTSDWNQSGDIIQRNSKDRAHQKVERVATSGSPEKGELWRQMLAVPVWLGRLPTRWGLTHTSLDSEASSMLSCQRNGRKLGVGNGSGSESLVKARLWALWGQAPHECFLSECCRIRTTPEKVRPELGLQRWERT